MFYTESHHLRIYGLIGKHNSLLWCRDKASTWESELKNGIPAGTISGERIIFPAGSGSAVCDLIWEDKRIEVPVENGWIRLPDFKRSIVVRMKNGK